MSTTIDYYLTNTLNEEQLAYAVIIAKHQGQWLLVRHKERTTWEVPGGHIEPGEAADDAARRELFEETGARQYLISAICDYTVTIDGQIGHGRLYTAEIETLGALPESEIAETKLFGELPENLTYPHIHTALLAHYLNTL